MASRSLAHIVPHRRLRILMLLAALVVGTGVGVVRGRIALRPDAPANLQYTVRVLDAASAQMEVALRIDDLKPGSVELGFSANSVASTAPASKFRIREALDDRGKPSKIEHRDGFWLIPHGRGALTIRYEVSLKAGREQQAYANVALSSMDEDGGRILGSDLFLFPLDVPARSIRVDWELPDGWQLQNPWRIASTRTAPPHLQALYASVSALGNHRLIRQDIGGYTIDIAVRGAFNFGDDALSRMVGDIVQQEIDFFERAPGRRYLFIIEPHPESDDPEQLHYFGLHFNSSMILLIDPRSHRLQLEREPAMLCAHEFFHSWLGELIRQNHYDMNWFVEGVTSLYADRALLATRRMDYGTWTEQMRDRYENEWIGSPLHGTVSVAAAGKVVLVDPGYTRLLYSAGPLLALSLDYEIQARTGGYSSLDDLVRAMADQAFTDPDFRLTRTSLVDDLDALTGTDFGPWLDRYAWGTEDLPLPDAIRGTAHTGVTGR